MPKLVSCRQTLLEKKFPRTDKADYLNKYIRATDPKSRNGNSPKGANTRLAGIGVFQ